MSRGELTKALPAQSVPSTLGGVGDKSIQNLSWLNVMSEEKQSSSAQAKRDSYQSSRSFDEGLGVKRGPILPRAYYSSKKDSESRAHPFSATANKIDSSPSNNIIPHAAADKRQPPSSSSSSTKGVASMISNWEGRSSLKQPFSVKPVKQSSDKSHNTPAINGSVSDVADRFAHLTPSNTLKMNWGGQDSLHSNEGDYISNWIKSSSSSYENVTIGLPQYENVSIDDKPNPSTSDHRPLFQNVVVPDQSKLSRNVLSNSSGAYEIMDLQPTSAHPIKPNPPNRKLLVVSSTASKLTHSYVNVEIPSDPDHVPPPVPSKKKKVPVKLAEHSDDSELDEEEGNELQYENWSFLNVHEGDQNMNVSELEAYVKSRKLQGLKAEYFKIRNIPNSSEMKICK